MGLSAKIDTLAQRIGQEIKLAWAGINGKEPVIIKNTAFNKNFGTASETVCQGNDDRLSDNRTPISNSVSFTKVAADLNGLFTISDATGTQNINLATSGSWKITLTGSTAFSFSGFQKGKWYFLEISGDYALDWGGLASVKIGSYDAGTNTYGCWLFCTEDTSGSENVNVYIQKYD